MKKKLFNSRGIKGLLSLLVVLTMAITLLQVSSLRVYAGSTTCTVCHGSRTIETNCSTCDGTGKKKCEACEGSGTCYDCGVRYPNGNCEACECSGEIECSACGGSGKTQCGEDCECSGCSEGGRCNGCPNCPACTTCGGKGKVVCKVCNGSTCSTCKGSKTCSTCSGSKYSNENCTNCVNGKVSTTCETCKGTGNIHSHDYASVWSSDATKHWHAATCEHTSEKSGEAVHTWDDNEAGKCSVCEYQCLHTNETGEVCSVCGKSLSSSSTPTVSSISMKSTPTKTTYNVGDTLDITGAQITVTKSDSTTEVKNITSSMVSGFDSTTAGTKTVTITYEGKTTTFTVTVKESGSSSGGSSSSDSSGSSSSASSATPATTEKITSGVSEKTTVNISATVSKGTAAVSEITREDLAQAASAGNVTTIKIDVSTATQDVKSVDISKTTLTRLVETLNDTTNNISTVSIITKSASVVLDAATLNAVVSQAKGNDIQLVVDNTVCNTTLNAAQQNAISKKEVATIFEAYFGSNGQRIGDFNGGKAVVTLAFNPPAGKDKKYYHVEYIADDGTVTRFPTKFTTSGIEFTATHFSDYCIVYDTTTANETAGATCSVVKGDSLSKIAKKNGMTLSVLKALNPQIKNPNKLHVGDVIYLSDAKY